MFGAKIVFPKNLSSGGISSLGWCEAKQEIVFSWRVGDHEYTNPEKLQILCRKLWVLGGEFKLSLPKSN